VVILKQKISPYLVSDLFTTFLQLLVRVFLGQNELQRYELQCVFAKVKEYTNTLHNIKRKKANCFDSHLAYELHSRRKHRRKDTSNRKKRKKK
jgi:hypothetical protein